MLILSTHALHRARERVPLLTRANPARVRELLSRVAATGSLIPCMCLHHEMRQAYIRPAYRRILVQRDPYPGAFEVIVVIDVEPEVPILVTVMNDTLDLPEAPYDHPRKYAPNRRQS